MGSSYTFFKPLDLSRSNGKKKKTIINANILTSISLIIPCLLHSIRISKPNKRIHLILSLSLSLYVWCSSLCLFVCLRLLLLHHCSKLPSEKEKKKKTNRINVLWVVCFYYECSLSTFGVQAFVSPFVSVCCSSSTIVPGCYQNRKKKKKKSH